MAERDTILITTAEGYSPYKKMREFAPFARSLSLLSDSSIKKYYSLIANLFQLNLPHQSLIINLVNVEKIFSEASDGHS